LLPIYKIWCNWFQKAGPLKSPMDLGYYSSFDAAFIMCEILYRRMLADPKIWEIAGRSYTRKSLTQMFIDDLGHSVCCYCDINTNSSAEWFEHFLPKSLFPFLAVHPQNLYVCCSACNLPQTGKGQAAKFPTHRPDERQMADDIKFDFKSGSVVAINCGSDNFFSSLKLAKRYSKHDVFRDVESSYRLMESWIRLGSTDPSDLVLSTERLFFVKKQYLGV
jgi:uncharacterized protein (TIGR02646 family)